MTSPAGNLHSGPTMADSELLRPSPATQISAYLLAAVLTVLWTWWALVDGAFFSTVMLPGSILLMATLAIVLAYAPLPLARRGPHALVIAGLTGLAVWSALSMLWSPAPDQALENAQRAFVYVAAYGAGLLLAMALRRRLLAALAPFLVAGAIVATVVIARIWLADDAGSLVDAEGTLAFPFGYRNANANFFVIVAIASLGLLSRAGSGPVLRAGTGGLAAAALSLAAISQSRGSLLAAVAGLVILIVASRRRGRALVGIAAVLLPVALVFVELLGPYDAAQEGRDVLAELQTAAVAALVASLAAALLCALWSIVERRAGRVVDVRLPSRRTGLIAGISACVVAAVIALAVAGNPLDWFDDPSSSGSTATESSGSRFTYSGGLNRSDFWRVALGQAADSPIAGGGAGSYRARYLLERETYEAPRDAHSLPLEILGELGIVGLALLLLALVGAVGAAVRSRRLGPEAATLSAAALAAGAAWGAQACVDWSWSFAGLTGPVLALLGSAAATSALSLTPLSRNFRRGGIALACVVAVIAVPTFASARLTLNAATGWPNDLEGAYGALDSAASLNPVSDLPALVKAEIARQNGDANLALDSLEDARERQPDEFQNHLLAAEVLASIDDPSALEQVEQALALNPRSKQALKLQAQLESASPSG